MSADITESGKAWIPINQGAKHFKDGDTLFACVGDEITIVQWPIPDDMGELLKVCPVYLKLATVAWPEFPYSAEDIENAGREE